MTELERLLREGLHDRLDDVAASADLAAAVPSRAAWIHRRRTAVAAGAVALSLTGGVVAVATEPRWRGGAASIRVADDGASPTADAGPKGTEERAEQFARQMAAGDFASIRGEMTSAARDALTETRLRLTWRSAFGSGDSTYTFGRVTPAVTGDRPVASLRVKNHTGAANLYVIYNGADVSGLLLVDQVGARLLAGDPAVRRAREVLTQLADDDFGAVRADFDETMLAGLSEERLEASWRQTERTYGPVQATEGQLVVLTASGHRVVDVVMRFETGVMKLRVAFDARHRIAGLFILVLDA